MELKMLENFSSFKSTFLENHPSWAAQLIDIAIEAGEATLSFFDKPIEVEKKADDSPVTLADQKAHAIIESRLSELNLGTIISEEGNLNQHPSAGENFWLVDPLDGTKEFISGSKEYTVNIAHIVNGKTNWGVVYAPALQEIYVGGKEYGSIKISEFDTATIRCGKLKDPIKLMGSRRHGLDKLNRFVDLLKQRQAVELVSMGSSLKACKIAEGAADAYVRFGPTSEWDTAACHAVLEGAGGQLTQLGGGAFHYNQTDHWLNPPFVAFGADSQFWLDLLSRFNKIIEKMD